MPAIKQVTALDWSPVSSKCTRHIYRKARIPSRLAISNAWSTLGRCNLDDDVPVSGIITHSTNVHTENAYAPYCQYSLCSKPKSISKM